MIFYFSGTGNSLKAAQMMAEETNSELVFISDEYDGDYKVHSGSVGFIYPVYCYDIPDYVKAFIEKLNIEEDTYCYSIVTCGLEAGNALGNLNELLKEKNLKLNYGRVIIMPDNCSPMLGSDCNRDTLPIAYRDIKKIVKDIKNKKEDREEVVLDEDLIEKINMAKDHVKKEWGYKEVIKDKCILCNKCVELCPTNNIGRVGDVIEIKDNCVNCLACMHWCPEEAVKMKELSFEKEDKYTNPDIEYKAMLMDR